MLRFALARRAVMAAAACSAVVLPVVLTPARAWAEAPNPSACSGLHHGQKPGSLAITTSPGNGTVLRPGDEVEVTATWDTAEWGRPVLHKVLNCLLVNGSIDYDRSFQEKPTDNDGLYRYRFTVPVGAPGRICDRVRLSGRIVDDGDLVVQKSNTVCFSIQAAGGSGTPAKPADDTSAAATPVPGDSPAPLQPAPPVIETASADPAPAPGAPVVEISSVADIPTLPRTGGDPLPLVRLGVLLVLTGGAVLAARAALTRQAAPSPLRI